MVKLDERMLESNAVGRLLLHMFKKHVVAHGRLIRSQENMLKHRSVVIRTTRSMIARHINDNLLASLSHHGIDPIEHFGRLVNPHFDKTLVAFARRIASKLVEKLHAINLATLGKRRLGIYDTPVFARFGNLVVFLGHDELHARVGGGARRA